MNFEKKIKENCIYDGKILKLTVDEVELQNGHMSKREIVHHNGGAAVLLVIDGKVLLVKQFRYAYQKEIYEIPAGKLEQGEDPLLAAKRELEEETGYKGELRHLINIYPTPGYTNEIIYIFEALEAKKAEQHLDKDEFLDVELIEIEKVIEMIKSGEIQDAKTVTAVLAYIQKI